MTPKKMTITTAAVNPSIQAHLATPEDAPRIMELFRITAEWLRSKGSAQWADLLVGIDRHDTAAAIERLEVILFKQDDSPAAVVILMPRPSEWDNGLWGDLAADEHAVYLHRLSVHRVFAGNGLGRQIMKWLDEGVDFPPGKTCIRLDCIASNPTLNAFYREAGYAYIGERDGFCLYEKSLPGRVTE
ncbi:GNAT family N-acetyltransferase [Cohnella sp. GCM10027633]|uniref:GNAT family N-acetyltransferase n=1 Tax=unclassified Cohnella TaxID=2636738 RepID=UPI003633C5A9